MKSSFFRIFSAGLVRYSHKLAAVSMFTKSGEDHNTKKEVVAAFSDSKTGLAFPLLSTKIYEDLSVENPFSLPVDWVLKQYYDSNRSRVLGKCQGESYFRECCPRKNAGH
jgi:hypothetical protein